MFAGSGLLGMSNGLYNQVIENNTLANDLKEQILNGVRMQIENIDCPEGFI